ncbi:type II toxin-antitoxin system antitoxin SocA domain-containing protein [Clostridium sp.]|uniref:type II toxin-antitoxin system antitoxin SocA domain-containing protein n=1 Tax=Clostridium sp. TaxID=1506 RepID=UPI003D6D443D
MNKDYLINTIEIDCPICNKVHSLEVRKRLTQGLVKGEVVDYEEVYYLCPLSDEEENEFAPAGIMDENLLRARDAYRTKKGLLTSNEIATIRGFYGISQSDFSTMLGWGDITVTRYESKTIQDETYNNIMIMAYENPMFALESIDKHKDRFTIEKYNKIRNSITHKVEELGNLYLKKQEINVLYVNYQQESDCNGYKKLDIEKLASVIGYFSNFVTILYKVKLMKLLWYADSLYFRRHEKSMTGLVYKHMQYGALPIAFDEIMHLPTVKVVEEIIYEDISYKIIPNKEINISDFSLEELSVLEIIATTFKDYRAREIVDYMHKEKAYIDTESYQIIPYSLAKELRELR